MRERPAASSELSTAWPGLSLAAVRYTTMWIWAALSAIATYLPPPRMVGLVQEPSEHCPGGVLPVVL